MNVGIIMNGVTGRMGLNQHLARSILAIRSEGGVPLPGGERLIPDPILVGRDEAKLRAIAGAHGVERLSTDLDACLANPTDTIYFDATSTSARADHVRRAIAAGKHVYCEKPVADALDKAVKLAKLAKSKNGIKHGVVQDKLFLPGLRKMRMLRDAGFFGRLLSVRCEFGYWVFEGDWGQPAQRPSWNYRKKDGGGLILDMYPHWRYVIENTLGPMRRVISSLATATPARIDEKGALYDVDVDDNASTLIELESGAIGTILSSWATRVRRDDLLTFQIDGSNGSAVAGLHRCYTATNAQTPRTAHFSIATDLNIDYRANWEEVADPGPFKNPYRIGWENFLRQLATGAPMQADFAAGIRDGQFAEACYRSVKDEKWVRHAPRS